GISNAGINNFLNSFIQSAEFAGVLKRNSENPLEYTLKSEQSSTLSHNIEKSEIVPPDISRSFFGKLDTLSKINNEMQTATLRLTYGNATIQAPAHITEKDKERLKGQIDIFVTSEEIVEE